MWIHKSGKKIYFRKFGEGEPVIFLNGMLMSTDSYKPFVERFSKHMQVILVDLVDQGMADSADEQYEISYHNVFIKELIDQLGYKSCSLVGISYGGCVALSFATEYPEYVTSLAIYNSTATYDEYCIAASQIWLQAFEAHDEVKMKRLLYPLMYSRDYYIKNADRLERWTNARRKDIGDEYFDKLRRAIISQRSLDVEHKLKDLNIPVTVFGAEHDFVLSIQYQEDMAKAIKDSVFINAPGTGHCAIFEQPELFYNSLFEHMERVDKAKK